MTKTRYCKRYCDIWGIWEYYRINFDFRNCYIQIYRYDLDDWDTSFHNVPPKGDDKDIIELTKKQCENEIRAYHAMKELVGDINA